MYGVECVESIFQLSQPSASFFVVEINEDKCGKCQIFCAEAGKEKISCNKIYGFKESEDIEDCDQDYAEPVVVTFDLLRYKGSKKCCHTR